MYVPPLGDAVPHRGGAVSHALGRFLMRLGGWRFAGEIPNRSQMVVIGAPHTSNWDFILSMSAMLALGIQIHWLGKHTLFRPPFGRVMRWFGGLPVDRSSGRGVVEQIVETFRHQDPLLIGISPEGTRKKVHVWKTGFHRIARGAGVPIMLFYMDYGNKVFGIGPLMEPSDDLDADLETIQTYYRQFKGKRPELG